jgi:hypothetical protein
MKQVFQLCGSSSSGRPGAPPQDALPFQLAAVNKFDLLLTQATAKRVEQRVRSR